MMNFFEKLVQEFNSMAAEPFGGAEPSEDYLNMLKEREEIKGQIHTNLVALKFSSNEIGEVFGIIDFHYKQIEDIKKSLIGSNINNDPTKQMEKAQSDIKKITNMMLANLRQKVQEIRTQKGQI